MIAVLVGWGVSAMMGACSSSSGGGGGGGGAGDDAVSFFTDYQEASVVIGQDDFEANSVDEGTTTADRLRQLYSNSWVEDGTLFVPDYDNSRILGYDTIPDSNGASADFVIGQADLESDTESSAANGLNGPGSVQAHDGRLYVADFDNHRVTVYDPVPATSTPTADLAVGQTDTSSSGQNCTATGLDFPESLFLLDDMLLIADSGNARVLVYDELPTASGVSASLVLGQTGFVSCDINTPANDAAKMSYPADVWTDGTRLAVVDRDNHRVLIWNEFPASNGQSADLVLGQADFDGTGAGDGERGLNAPYAVTSDGTRFIVADNANHRVLIWDTFPTETNQAPDAVLGQSDFDHNAANDDDQDGDSDATASARTLFSPSGVRLVGTTLFVADGENYRILIFEGEDE